MGLEDQFEFYEQKIQNGNKGKDQGPKQAKNGTDNLEDEGEIEAEEARDAIANNEILIAKNIEERRLKESRKMNQLEEDFMKGIDFMADKTKLNVMKDKTLA